MKNLMKRELVNDIVTGLLVAASFAAVVPADAFAQLSAAAVNVKAGVLSPVVTVAGYISYGLGTVMVIKGISDVKKHTENPGSNPLGKGLGALGTGAAFLAAPAAANMLQTTGGSVIGNGAASFSTLLGN